MLGLLFFIRSIYINQFNALYSIGFMALLIGGPTLLMVILSELDHYFSKKETNIIDSRTTEESLVPKEQVKVEIPFREKYLNKFKHLLNDYMFTPDELEREKELSNQLLCDYNNKRQQQMKDLHMKIKTIDQLIEKYRSSIESDEELEEKIDNLTKRQLECRIEIEQLEQNEKTLCFFLQEARQELIRQKHERLLNNYVMEYTPSGNVYMRYNYKDSLFEYYSDDTISYAHLEVVGRKYAIYYQCKPIYHYVEPVNDKDSKIKFDINISKAKMSSNSNRGIPDPKAMMSLRPSMTRRKPAPLFVNTNAASSSSEITEPLTNKYKRIGLLKDAKLLQTVPIKKSKNISYSDYKLKGRPTVQALLEGFRTSKRFLKQSLKNPKDSGNPFQKLNEFP